MVSEYEAINQLTQKIKSYNDLFSPGDNTGLNTDLYNLVTKKVVCQRRREVQQSEKGQKFFSLFVEDRVNLGTQDRSLGCD